MKTKIIEAAQSKEGKGFSNWGKFLVGRMDTEWDHVSAMSPTLPLLARVGWSVDHLWVMDLQTGEGACFKPGGLAQADLTKHRIWVCPLFEPFLTWLYLQDVSDLDKLPDFIELPDAEPALSGYRRPGPEGA